MKELKAKILEALISALPISAIVYLMSLLPWFNFTATELITFTVGAVFLILGNDLFNLGAELAMTPMGNHVGAGLSRQKKLWLLLVVSFVMGLLITVAEPDLQVLANQVKSVMNGTLLIYAVGLGVGGFLVIAILRIVFRQRLSNILMLFYMVLFALALLLAVNENLALLPVAFVSGGVAREKEAAFFGITIQQEKEILMMVVEKDIKDKVLNALYSQMGMAKHAKGIAFSLPVSDVAGLVQIPLEEAKAE